MPDPQTQSASSPAAPGAPATPALDPSTVNAFLAAPRAKQVRALGEMSIPAKQALLAALRERKERGETLQPFLQQFPGTTGPKAEPAPTPAAPTPTPTDLTANPSDEGTYALTRAGHKVEIPYSKVPEARKQGYEFADQGTIERYGKDFSADPRNQGPLSQWTAKHPLEAAPLNYLSAFGGSAEQTVAGLDRLVAAGVHAINPSGGPGTEQSLQLEAAKQPHTGLAGLLGAGSEQIAELLTGETAVKGALEGTELAAKAGQAGQKVQELTALLDKYPKLKLAVGLGLRAATEAGKAGAEQGTQELVRSGGNVGETEQVAKGAGLVGAITPLGEQLVGEGNQFIKRVLRHKYDIEEFNTGQLVDKVKAENQAIDKEAEKIHSDNVNLIKKARKAGDDAEAARLEHNNVVAKQQALAAKRQNLSDALERTRQTVYQRLQNMKLAARSYFHKAYGDIEDSAEGKQVTLSSLADDMHEALQHVSGSEKSTQTFKDIASKVKGLDKAEEAAGFTEEDLADLAPDERARLAEHLQETEGIGASVPLEDLEGYYSELGRVAASKSTPGDLKAAANAMRESIDRRIKATYGEDVYKQVLKVRGQYREFAHGFLDSDSPIQKAVEAREHYHGTQPFLTKEGRQAAVRTDVRNTVIGDAGNESTQYYPKTIHEGYTRVEGGKLEPHGEETPAWRYRRQTHSLIEHMRNLETGLEKTEYAAGKATTAEAASAEKVAATRSAAREAARPDLAPPPAPKTMTPAELQDVKRKVLVNSAHNLGKFGTWVAIGGVVGGTALFLRELIKGGNVEAGLSEGALAVVVGLVTPYYISKMLTSPTVVESLTKVSRGDLEQLMKLPPAQRAGTEEMLRKMSEEAVREGKISAAKAPWLRIGLGTVARRQVEATHQHRQAIQQGLSSLDDLNRQLGVSGAGLPPLSTLNQPAAAGTATSGAAQ